jgi:hypothetical protein
MSLRDTILQAKDRPLLAVEVPEWGTTVFLKVLGGAERDLYERRLVAMSKANDSSMSELMRLMCCLSLCDASGTRLFTEAEVDLLAEKNAEVVTRLGVQAAAHSKARTDDIETTAGN